MAPTAVADDVVMDGTEGVGKPPSHVVLPPKEIRTIVETTAGYIARNGPVFEDRIREKNSANPKFSFLNENDAYNAFYIWRLEEIRAGRGTVVSAGRAGEGPVKAEEEKPKGPEEPPEFHFSARMPNIAASDMEVIKLTALFAAKNGRTFMTQLSQKEAANYQFDFLRPQHSLYQFFSRLVDQYSELLNARGSDGGKAEQARIVELTKNVDDKFHLLGRAKQRAEWVKHQEKQKQQKEEEEEKEKLEFAQIDWHDFVVVETVLFTDEDEVAELPAPTSLNDLQSASLEQKAEMSLAPHNMRIEETMPGESTYYNGHAQQPQQQQSPYPQQSGFFAPPPPPPQQQQSTQPTPPPTMAYAPPPPAPIPQAYQSLPEQPAPAAPTASRPAAGAPMKIRDNYVPRAQAARGKQSAAVTICPNCKLPIPYAEIEEHMRIELLDPRWKEQKAKAESHYATTNLSTGDVANNLKRLASQRTDVFDPITGLAVSEEEAARRKRAAVAYAGVPGQNVPMPMPMPGPGMQGQGMSIEEQLKYLKEKAAREGR